MYVCNRLNCYAKQKYDYNKDFVYSALNTSTGPSFLMADPMGPPLDQDEEEALSPSSSLEGKAPASPPLSFSSYPSPLSPYQTMSSSPLSSSSPPPSPPPTPQSLFLGTKAGADSLLWLGASDLLDSHIRADSKGEGDVKLRFAEYLIIDQEKAF